MNEVVEQIHIAFDDAQDFLLREAKKYEKRTAPSKSEAEYAEKMTELGFVKSAKVKDIREREEAIQKSRKLSQLVRHYKKTYPFLKFVTVVQLDAICEKYNLIYAPVRNYIKEVPEKNLAEIASAQELKENDKVENHRSVTRRTGYIDTETTDQQGLFIAAPESHFDLKGLKKKGKLGFFKVTMKTEPDDPIVFRYVRGGIQVLSKWGEEANDPMLANPIDN